MCGVHETGDITSLTGLDTANGVGALKPGHSGEENRHTQTQTWLLALQWKCNSVSPTQTSYLISKAHSNQDFLEATNCVITDSVEQLQKSPHKQFLVNIKNTLKSLWFSRTICQQIIAISLAKTKVSNLWRVELPLMSLWSSTSSCVGMSYCTNKEWSTTCSGKYLDLLSIPSFTSDNLLSRIYGARECSKSLLNCEQHDETTPQSLPGAALILLFKALFISLTNQWQVEANEGAALTP